MIRVFAPLLTRGSYTGTYIRTTGSGYTPGINYLHNHGYNGSRSGDEAPDGTLYPRALFFRRLE